MIDQTGSELDALVAVRVMNDHHYETAPNVSGRFFWWRHRGELFEAPPPYSVDIRYAMKVVSELATRATPWHLTLRGWPSDFHPGWSARFTSESSREPSSIKRHVEAEADTPEVAICMAALVIVEIST